VRLPNRLGGYDSLCYSAILTQGHGSVNGVLFYSGKELKRLKVPYDLVNDGSPV